MADYMEEDLRTCTCVALGMDKQQKTNIGMDSDSSHSNILLGSWGIADFIHGKTVTSTAHLLLMDNLRAKRFVSSKMLHPNHHRSLTSL